MLATKKKNARQNLVDVAIFASVLILILSIAGFASGQPTGANFTYNVTDTIAPTAASSLVTAGGSFTTMVLNGTFQTQKWKAYVGNVTGIISLDDANKNTIYDWNLAIISGEVYVTRNETVDWSTVTCADNTSLGKEEAFLNINTTSADSINNTFNDTIHQEFYVGTQQIIASSCRAIATYINDAQQVVDENADFQEVLLEDANENMVFAGIIENSLAGYDNSAFDFQMIVPEDETSQTPNEYYFYVEIS